MNKKITNCNIYSRILQFMETVERLIFGAAAPGFFAKKEINDFLIVGGGISGLFMGYLLQKNGFKCKILERDESLETRRQGFSLTMQGRTEKIFREYGLLDELYENGSFSNQKIFYNGNGEILHKSGMRNFNYPVPRQKLREMFYKRLETDTVYWNKNVSKISHNYDSVQVECTDGTCYRCKTLIGCDGLNSKVRNRFIPNFELKDFGLVNIYGLTDLDGLHPIEKEFFEHNTIQILDGHNRLFFKPFDVNTQMWELTYPHNKNSKSDQKFISTSNACSIVLQLTKQWKLPIVYNAIKSTNISDIIVHPLYDHVPTKEELDNLPENVVLIGDAVHPMSPSIGLGANEAISDCYDFINLLVKCRGDMELVSREFKHNLLYRTTKTVLKSRENMEFYHTIDAIDKEKLANFKGWNNFATS